MLVFCYNDYTMKLNLLCFMSGVSNTRPARAFCAARNAFWEFSKNYYLRYLVYS